MTDWRERRPRPKIYDRIEAFIDNFFGLTWLLLMVGMGVAILYELVFTVIF